MSSPKLALGLACSPLPLTVIIILLLSGGNIVHGNANQPAHPAGATELNDTAVPAWALAPLTTAATTCPQITAPILAAQIETESSWNPTAYNEASQAAGLAQFIPSTWASWGTDGDHDGTTDPHNPADAIASQAAYLCHLLDLAHTADLNGDPVDLALASYNAGPANVKKYSGIPPFPETRNYITKIRALAATKYSHPPHTGPSGVSAVIQAAANHVGQTMYAWGGGTLTGPSPGATPDQHITGFDCSSLIRYAYYQGTNHTITLPRTAQEQYTATKNHPVAPADLQPGDLLFWGDARIHHVALYIGNGKMIEAPRSGKMVTETTVRLTGDYAGATRPLNQAARSG